MAAAAGLEAVDGGVGGEGECDVAEGDEVARPFEFRHVAGFGAVGGDVADGDAGVVGADVADDVEGVAALLAQQAVDECAGLRALHAGEVAVAAISTLVPTSKVAVMVTAPLAEADEVKYSRFSTPFNCSSIGAATVRARVSAEAPG